MTSSMRACAGPADFPAISDFLYRLYRPGNRDGNWLQPIWEYAYTHPWFDTASIDRIGIWRAGGAIVGVAMYELQLGEAFFQTDPAYVQLRPEMLAYAEARLAGVDDAGRRYLKAYVNDFDTEFEDLVRSRGYLPEPGAHRPIAQFSIPAAFPPLRVAPGFRLKSLADDNDLARLDRVLWRGFNHPGAPPADGPAARALMQQGPHYRKDLAIVAEAPNREFASFAGLWFDPANQLAYVEPVATDPSYRRMGLGTATVLEGIRRCGALGATVAYVGSDQPFYLAMGFEPLFTLNCWRRYL